MHVRRVLVLAVALLTAFGVSASLGAAPSQAAAKERHRVIYQANEIRDSGVFQTYGRSATAAGRIIYLQRKNCRGDCRWYNVKQVRTGKPQGRFYMKFTGPRGSCYRLFITAGPYYYAWAGNLGCIIAE